MSDQVNRVLEINSEAGQLCLEFVKTELKAYFAVTSRAETQYESGRPEAARKSQALAETGYVTIQRYMSDPVYSKHLRGEERREIDSELGAFRRALDWLRGVAAA
jgi:hypothetical protein